MIWRQLLRLFLRAVSGLLWVGAGLIVKQARRVEELAQALRNAPQAPEAGDDGPPAHWLEAARSPGPPQHWVDRVRQGAPHLLAPAPDAASSGRRRTAAPRGAGNSGVKRAATSSHRSAADAATEPPQEAHGGSAAQPPLRMRIRVLDEGAPTARSSAKRQQERAQERAATAAGEAAASGEDVKTAEPGAAERDPSAATEPPQFAPPAPRRSSAALAAQPAPGVASGAEDAPSPLSKSDSHFPEPAEAPKLQPELPASRAPALDDGTERIYSQPSTPLAAHGDAQSGATEAVGGDLAGADAAQQRRQLRAPEGAAMRSESQAGAATGALPEAGAAREPGKRQPARWAEAPAATEVEEHAPSAPSENEEHWPSLPSPETAKSPATEAVLRVWKHRRRLDDEQRGAAWNG